MTPLTPLQTAKALFDALASNSWLAAAALVDVDSLAAWRDFAIASLADEAEFLSQPESSGATLRQVLTDSNTVAARLQAHGDTVFPDLGLSLTLAQLAALPASELFARYLELTASLRRASGDQASPHLMGDIVENDSNAYALYRWEGMGWPKAPHDVSVLCMRNGPSGWRCLVDRVTYGPSFPLVAPGRYG